MAWRDSRRNRRRMLIFSSSIVLGVAALVAIRSFAEDMAAAVEKQAHLLLGADLSITAREPFTPEAEALFAEIGGEQSREITFSSMVYFPTRNGTRLVQVRALEGGFPFYGEMEIKPPDAGAQFRTGEVALVEPSLLAQFDVDVGDPVRLGDLSLPIGGRLLQIPGESVGFSTIAPRVFIPLELVDRTQLLQEESFARFKVYFKLPPGQDAEELVEKLRPRFEELRLDSDTVEERKERMGRSFGNLSRFLNLAGFVALLLGGIGVASAIHAQVKDRLPTIAILRCLGAVSGQAFAVYVAQAVAMGLFGALLGTAIGILIQQIVPQIMDDFTPVSITVGFRLWPIITGASAGLGICLVFALLPLAPIRKLPALGVLRTSFDVHPHWLRDGWLWGCYLALAAITFAFANLQSRHWTHALAFSAGAGISFLLLAAIAKLVAALFRKFLPSSWPYVWRQGLANLYRPNNRTVMIMVSLGLGTFLILTLYLTRGTMLARLLPSEKDQPNAALFDIQHSQKEGVIAVLREHGLPILQEAPIVTMRLSKVKGRTVEEILNDPNRSMSRWPLHRQYRSTYRAELSDSEKLVAGQWHERIEPGTEPIPVSLETGIAEELSVGLGDILEWDIQGVPIETVVASLREVDWRRMQPNFFVVFPPGPLDEAPAFHVLVTRVESSEESAKMQSTVVQAFPNVSVIDLTLVLQTLESILDKVAFVTQFMALFTVATGILVLISSLLTSRYQRVQEAALLRTLGASRRQVSQILLAEYLVLGLFAGITAGVLSIAASWALAHFLLEVRPVLSWGAVGIAVLTLMALTAAAGWLTTRTVCRAAPLEVLRHES